MGGGGSYYDRDVTDNRRVDNSRGYSDIAERALRRAAKKIDSALRPKNRLLRCTAESALVFAFDVTRSMGTLPKIFFDKIPMIAGQLMGLGYLGGNFAVSTAAIGDVYSDKAPIQVGDFGNIQEMDQWLKKLWLEYGGGGTGKESYEFMAYVYAYMCDLGAAKNRFFIFTGDEDYYDDLTRDMLEKYFGGERLTAAATTVFDKLKKNFNGNVYMVHREHRGSTNERIVRRWQEALGVSNVVLLPEDKAIADIVLGIVALGSGARTLDGYVEDMEKREQTGPRIIAVRKALAIVREMKQGELTPVKTLVTENSKEEGVKNRESFEI